MENCQIWGGTSPLVGKDLHSPGTDWNVIKLALTSKGAQLTEYNVQRGTLMLDSLRGTRNLCPNFQQTVYGLTANDLKILMKTISGKNCLHYHLYDIGKAHTKMCTYCSPSEIEKLYLGSFGEETATHILCECQFFSGLRQKTYGQTSLNTDQLITGNIKKNH